MPAPTPRAKILFVDDEPNVLEGIRRQLRGQYDVQTAVGGMPGLVALEREGPFSVVVSDMQMPGMNGAAFLKHVKERRPETVRMLLTGHADIDVAMEAVNSGHIYRFLRKPCPPDVLQPALIGAVEQHRLLTAEKDLLERTLRGSVDALCETLALVSPTVLGASMRIRRLVTEIARAAKTEAVWEIEIAASVAQLGVVTLEDGLAHKLVSRHPLSDAEQATVAQLPEIADKLLAHIPRLEGVRAIIRAQHANFDGSGTPADLKATRIPVGARILRLATDLDERESSGLSLAAALATLKAQSHRYDPALLELLQGIVAARSNAPQAVCVRVDDLVPGSILAADVALPGGLVLVARGLTVTSGLIARLKSYRTRIRDNIVVHPCPK